MFTNSDSMSDSAESDAGIATVASLRTSAGGADVIGKPLHFHILRPRLEVILSKNGGNEESTDCKGAAGEIVEKHSEKDGECYMDGTLYVQEHAAGVIIVSVIYMDSLEFRAELGFSYSRATTTSPTSNSHSQSPHGLPSALGPSTSYPPTPSAICDDTGDYMAEKRPWAGIRERAGIRALTGRARERTGP
ncbi:hypothetical protein BP6252_09584 [Coleophoma cylindrospora]|uniref:Uncharacterized protein n=1 Tax=Coleophoma cylindrospora TaxID=1849047 RepID=A0A3D8QW10_9HELO|nr:hypothetical protein BP6252_09584 [Coleophoma cylindrospora]